MLPLFASMAYKIKVLDKKQDAIAARGLDPTCQIP